VKGEPIRDKPWNVPRDGRSFAKNLIASGSGNFKLSTPPVGRYYPVYLIEFIQNLRNQVPE
jgi:hypothetical protein